MYVSHCSSLVFILRKFNKKNFFTYFLFKYFKVYFHLLKMHFFKVNIFKFIENIYICIYVRIFSETLIVKWFNSIQIQYLIQ